MSRPIRFIRSISIAQSSAVVNEVRSSVNSTVSATVGAASVASQVGGKAGEVESLPTTQSNALESISFQTLNVPPTVLSISSPPSYPVYIKRGSLLSLYGTGSIISSVKSQFELLNPFSALLYGGRSSQYQKFISTKPYSLLVSSIASSYWFQKPSNKSFATIDLDGTSDWAVLPKDALQVYSGPSLGIQSHTLPRYISRKLSKSSNSSRQTPTGLFRWFDSGFTLLTGRGKVGLVASGSIYSISLNESEEILINLKNIVAITTNGAHDLENSVIKHSIQLSENSISEKSEDNQSIQKSRPSSSLNIVLANLKGIWYSTYSFFSRQQHAVYNQLVGNKDYVKVIGPRTLLVQSSNSNIKNYEATESQRIANTENLISAQIETDKNRKSSDYLSYVTITPQGAVFESTPDFSETVNALKERTEKKK
ncbi:altered inheritance of mitochondria protein 24, mitochondrial [[Candida] railenensis]|uniref:Altered inheritance of mitochondria protein 24, mitochondrial n=1 Tax=[Candida] railenensis TaxID=45579 RepID=A0A9P0QP61_9ASCO|nr:altered inheritance of mitochondria protein 24, mitochondrial [[Candida] railenensis]